MTMIMSWQTVHHTEEHLQQGMGAVPKAEASCLP